MVDLLSIAATIALFTIAVIYTRACDRITRSRTHA